MTTALRAGIVYFAIIFALGFAFGTFRVLVLVSHFGETTAVFLESPFILAAAWIVCSLLIKNYDVDTTIRARLVMGGSAFVLLMTAEQILAVYGYNRSVQEQALHYGTVAGAIGLAGQVAFGLFPIFQLLTSRRR